MLLVLTQSLYIGVAGLQGADNGLDPLIWNCHISYRDNKTHSTNRYRL
jgi:hypothetical protein